MSARAVNAGFTASRTSVLGFIYKLGVACCAYSGGEVWADRCDCKYVRGDEPWRPGIYERGNDCPELRSLYVVIDALDDDEWYRLVMRAGGTPRGAVLEDGDVGQRLFKASGLARHMEVLAGEMREVLGS